MKITLIGHYPPPYGGVAVLMKQMESALSQRGLKISIFNLGSGRPEASNVVNFKTDNRVLEFFQLVRSFAVSDTDIFHYLSASYRSFWLGAVCVALARLTGHKIVISIVGGAFRDFLKGLNPIAQGGHKIHSRPGSCRGGLQFRDRRGAQSSSYPRARLTHEQLLSAIDRRQSRASTQRWGFCVFTHPGD